MYALVIGCVLNKEFINFTTGEILQVHKLHVAAVAVPSRSSKLRFFVSSNASCSAWHCHKSDCKCTEALHGKAHGSGNARLSKPRKNKGTGTGRQLLRLIEQWKEGQRKVKDCHKLEAYSDCFKPGKWISGHSQNTLCHAPDVMIRLIVTSATLAEIECQTLSDREPTGNCNWNP